MIVVSGGLMKVSGLEKDQAASLEVMRAEQSRAEQTVM